MDNLCLSCIRCNLKKGPNIASIDPETSLIVSLFHPRRHSWREHFFLDHDGRLHGLTSEGRVTVQLMDMNDMERVNLRSLLLRQGWSPGADARTAKEVRGSVQPCPSWAIR